MCRAVTYHKLGRHAVAEAVMAKNEDHEKQRLRVPVRSDLRAAGDDARALEWLETVLRLVDWDLMALMVERLLDSLREESRFQAIEREMKFPT